MSKRAHERDGLKRVGYWYSTYEPDLPMPEETEWSEEDKEAVCKYLDEGEVYGTYRGMSTCRVCEKFNGHQDLTDGFWVWPNGLSHYIREHNTKLPLEFLMHVERELKGA